MKKFWGYGVFIILLVAMAVIFIKYNNKDVPSMQLEYTLGGKFEKVTVEHGTASWKSMGGGFEADGSHPLDSVGYMPEIKKTDDLKELKISFSSKPTSYTVRFWTDNYIGKEEAYENHFETLKTSNDIITLPNDEKGYIYEIHATWPQGNVYYAFYITNYNKWFNQHNRIINFVYGLSLQMRNPVLYSIS